ncbi:arylsulfotransferase family protein [Gordonia sp. CPCC 205515]|uniref:arylsulfotransferase family protein n=1 Tax=Gordonia sp. CPCC 205515 TaxID=3140791 RepID=UPI003AF3775C
MTKKWFARIVPLITAATMMVAGVAQAQAAPDSIYQVLTDARPNSGGVILLSPSNLLDNPAVPRLGNVAPSTPGELQVRARNGRILAKHPIPKGQDAGNFQIQTYQGKRVYTWWQGSSKPGHGSGTYFIADKNFHVLRNFQTPRGTSGDLHEFRILPDGRAAVSSYVTTSAEIGGVRIPVIDSRFYIMNIATGHADFSWSALAHVPVSANTTPLPIPGEGLDYFHINSVFPDGHGNYLISSRNTSALYLIDGRTGKVRWVIGGNRSTVKVDPAASFANQHDAQFTGDGAIRLFDNHAAVPGVGGPSAILTIRPDWRSGTVKLVSRWEHPQHLTAWAMGNAQRLSDGSIFGGWGTTGHITQFDARGRLVCDAKLSGTLTTYRSFWYPQGV